MTATKGMNFDPDAELVDPLDYLIIGALPDDGAMFAGAWPEGRTSKQLSKELFDGQLAPTQFGPRMNALRHHGLIVKKKGVGTSGAAIYQRTPKGVKLHKQWLAKQPAKSGDHE